MLTQYLALLIAAPLFTCAWMDEAVAQGLKDAVSQGTKIVDGAQGLPRWSEYGAPCPGTIVEVATEEDVQKTVRTNPPND